YIISRPLRSKVFSYTTLFRSNRCKLMIIGQGRAGKTSTVRSLLGIPFNPMWDSTIGITLKQSFAKVSGENWNELPKNVSLTTDLDRKSTRLNSSHVKISYAVF